MAAPTKGYCTACGATASKAGMSRHLLTCPPPDHPDEASEPWLRVLVEGAGAPEYWLYLDVRGTAMLHALDNFLRRTWLECCGHLSAFTIRGTRYTSYRDPDFEERGMHSRLGDVLGPDSRFSYEYDFGTTTLLRLRVLGERQGAYHRRAIRLLARNEPPPLRCCVCGEPAADVCVQCSEEGDGWLCRRCADAHSCAEEMLLPVVNSPRVGMCGYTG